MSYTHQHHLLRTDPGPFQLVWLGIKAFEIRANDRNFKAGDIVRLQEWHHNTGYTGRFVEAKIGCVITDPGWGIQPGFCVFGFTETDRGENDPMINVEEPPFSPNLQKWLSAHGLKTSIPSSHYGAIKE